MARSIYELDIIHGPDSLIRRDAMYCSERRAVITPPHLANDLPEDDRIRVYHVHAKGDVIRGRHAVYLVHGKLPKETNS